MLMSYISQKDGSPPESQETNVSSVPSCTSLEQSFFLNWVGKKEGVSSLGSNASDYIFSFLLIDLLFCLCWVFVASLCGLSLVAVSGGCSLVVVCGLLIAVVSLVAAHGLQSMSASVVVMQGLSCPAACGIFLDKGLNSCPLHQWVDSLPLDHWTSLPFREVLHLCLLNLIITIEQFCFF